VWSPSHRRIQILHINYKKKETVVIKKEFNNLKLEDFKSIYIYIMNMIDIFLIQIFFSHRLDHLYYVCFEFYFFSVRQKTARSKSNIFVCFGNIIGLIKNT
jgi:hypothetical protein